VRLLCTKIADAAIEGRRQLEAQQKDSEPVEGEEAEAPVQEQSTVSAPEVVEAASPAEFEPEPVRAVEPELVAKEA